jgi:hypothetical protein
MENNYYKTADLALVAVLLLFIPDSLEVVDRGNPYKVLFCFGKSPDLETLVKRYWSRELQVEPQAFFNEVKQVKVRIYAEN